MGLRASAYLILAAAAGACGCAAMTFHLLAKCREAGGLEAI